MKHDIGKLEERIVAVDRKVKRLESLHGVLNPIIHRPGWTTLPEFKLVNLALDSMESHADSLFSLQRQLVEAAGQIGQSETAQRIAS